MKVLTRLVRVLVFVVPAGLILAAVIWLAMPRVVEVTPADGSADIPAGSPVTLRFSRAMHANEVQSRMNISPAVPGEFTWQDGRLTFTPTQPWPAGAEVRVQIASGARPSGFLPLPFQANRSWSFTVRQPRLAFLSPASGPANIYLRDLLTGEDRPLTNFAAGVQDFELGPDGGVLIFSASSPQGGSDLYRIELFSAVDLSAPMGQEAEPLVSCSPATCRNPVISPGGDWLAYERLETPAPGQAERSQIWRLPLDPTDYLKPVGAPFIAMDALLTGIHPAWSPTGLLSIYSPDAMAFIVLDVDGVEQARFVNATGEPGEWQTDGSAYIAPEILFLDENVSPALQQQLERLADSHLMRYTLTDGEPLDLTGSEGIEDISPVFSPDGSRLVFARKYLDLNRWTPGRQIYLMDLEVRAAQPLTGDPDYTHFDFAWSPDGRRLAYVRFNQSALTDPPEIWIMDIDTGERTQIMIGGYSPAWVP